MKFFTRLAARRRAAVSPFVPSCRSRVRVAPVEAMERRLLMTTTPAWLEPGTGWQWDDGSNTLTVTGAATITADPGPDEPIVNVTGGNAHLTFDPADGNLDIHVKALHISNGATATVASVGANRSEANHRVLVIDSEALTIGATGKLDLTDNDLMVDYEGTPSPSPTTIVRDLLATGFNETAWDGYGIVSSAAAAVAATLAAGSGDPEDAMGLNLTFGDGDAGTSLFAGQVVDTTSVLVKFTFQADINLDGATDFEDASLFNGNYDSGATTGRTYVEGDLNYDGTLDFQDLSYFNGSYNPANGPTEAAPVLGLDGPSNIDVEVGEDIEVTGTYMDVNGQTVTLDVLDDVGQIDPITGTSSGRWEWTHPAITTPQILSVTLTASDGVTTPASTRTINLTVRPPAPEEVVTVTNGAYGVDVTWDAVAGTGVTYNVYVSTTPGFTPGASTLVASGLTGTHHTVTGLSPGTTYYTVVTVNAGGVASFGTSADAPTTTAIAQESEANGVLVYDMLNPGDDDESGVTHHWSPYSEQELRDGEHLENETITVTLTGLPKHQLLHVDPGTQGIPFPPGNSSITITVDGQTSQDGWYEHTGSSATIVVTAQGYGNGYYWVCQQLSVGAYRPSVTIEPRDTAVEGVDPASLPENTRPGFIVRRGGYQGPFPALTVSLGISGGTAESGEDYEPLPTTVTFDPGNHEKFVPLVPKDGDDPSKPEWTETVTLEVVEGDRYFPGNGSSTLGQIVDDDSVRMPVADLIQVNNDDDNGNYVPDLEETGVSGEDDLKRTELTFPTDVKPGAQVTLSAPESVNVWLDETKSTRLLGDGVWTKTWVSGSDTVPPTIWIEGLAGSGAVEDVMLVFAAHDITSTTQATSRPSNSQTKPKTTEVGIRILNRGADVTVRATDILIGQMVDAVVAIDAPPEWKQNPTYQWTVEGEVLRDYVATEAKAFTVRLADVHYNEFPFSMDGLQRPNVTFFWVTTPSTPKFHKLRLTVGNINGEAYKTHTTFDVYEPTSELTLLTANVGIGDIPGSGRGLGVFTDQATVNADHRKRAGMIYIGKVELPERFTNGDPGTWYMVKRITSNNKAWTANGKRWTVPRNGEPLLLDQDPRATLRTVLPPYSGAGNTQFTGPVAFAHGDSPHNPFGDIGDANNPPSPMIKTERQDAFDLHLMFVPPGSDSRPVPLKHVEFGWSAGATVSDQTGDWFAHLPATKTESPTEDTSEHPTWPKNKAPTLWELIP